MASRAGGVERPKATPPGTDIAKGTTIRGRLAGSEPLTILGRVEGAVSVAGAVLIEKSAVVKAEVEGHEVVIRGILIGDARAGVLRVEPGAKVKGSLSSPRLSVAEGARIDGAVAANEGASLGESEIGASMESEPVPTVIEAAVESGGPPPRTELERDRRKVLVKKKR
jgi:cytoskeletal protein CcmA (bactofilin family)